MRFAFFLIVTLLLPATSGAYYGRSSIEAVLSFEALLDAPWKRAVPGVAELNRDGEAREAALKMVHKQVLFIDGVFHSDTFARKWGGPASPGPWYQPGTYEVKFTGVSKQPNGRIHLRYEFESTIVVQKDPLRRKETEKMELWIPFAPDLIHGLATKWGKNQCTDREDDGAESFYYFWDPFLETCPLRKKHPESIQTITADVRRLPNTRYTYPEYDQLYKEREEKPTLDIAVFWGYISHGVKAKKPFYRDDAYKTLKTVSEKLEHMGFDKTEDRPHFYIDKNGRLNEDKGANVMRKYEKLVKKDGREVRVRLQLLLSDTDLHAKDKTFHFYLKPAINKADIFVYDGHSGDGDNLSFEKIGIKPPKAEKYQLFFINGCDSYMNYLQQFITARGGLDNMNLLLSSTPTDGDAGPANDWTFLEPFLSLERHSYQKMIDRIEDSNPGGGTFLLGVVGDEKNKWRPAR